MWVIRMAYYIINNNNCNAYINIPESIPENHIDGIVEITKEDYDNIIQQIEEQQEEIFE